MECITAASTVHLRGTKADRLVCVNMVLQLHAGLVLLGVGAPLSFQVCTIFYNRLICHNLPAREVVVSSFLPVGATAMTAWYVHMWTRLR